MNHRTKSQTIPFVAGLILGVILAAVVAVPFYGFTPLIVVIGTLVALGVIHQVRG